jgi:hypothetical protein
VPGAADGLASLVPTAATYSSRLQSLPGGHPLVGMALAALPKLPPPLMEGARWVSDALLPLWLVKSYEEKARREAAIEAAKALRDAERVRSPMSVMLCSSSALFSAACAVMVL